MKPLTQEERLIIDKISGKQIKEINYENRKKDGIKYNVSGFEKSSTFRFFKEEDVKFAVEMLKKKLPEPNWETDFEISGIPHAIIKLAEWDLFKIKLKDLFKECFPVFQEQLENEGENE